MRVPLRRVHLPLPDLVPRPAKVGALRVVGGRIELFFADGVPGMRVRPVGVVGRGVNLAVVADLESGKLLETFGVEQGIVELGHRSDSLVPFYFTMSAGDSL